MQSTHRTSNEKTGKKLQSKMPPKNGKSSTGFLVLLLGNLSYGWGLRPPTYYGFVDRQIILQENVKEEEIRDVHLVPKVDTSLVSFFQFSVASNLQHLQ